ncbi:MAG: sugar kinase [Thaumarchaeota archaeon]|jgi:fructokinase|uniref:ROK family protein (ScrK) n=1 Tax=uncultured marine thaumarchaeote KM3_203_A01 TaxID=1456097 RepID=A0A075GUB9_9ARCH|nr:ROK family protein (scrK) [uncultured marine thaumarchaeote KM3_203_A01]MAS89692.1 sugar kinase [Nitrososphaerota archaeon]
MHKIGIDLGGTKTEGILLDEKFEIVERKRLPTNQQEGYSSIINLIKNLVDDLKQKTDDSISIGVCTPGALSKQSGVIKNSNTQCLIGKDIKNDLENVLKQKVSIENDANCFTLAESKLGSAKNFDMVFGVIMGTGVGGGIVIKQQIHNGRTNIAGEWGHHCIKPEGNSCYCGKSGCVETYLSGPALEKRWNDLSGKRQTISEILQNSDESMFTTWKNELLENFALALGNVIDILDPDAIVLGGGLSNIPFLYDEGQSYVHQQVFTDQIDTPILKNKLGDSAGVFGACMI